MREDPRGPFPGNLGPNIGGSPGFTTRINPFTRKHQILSTDILTYLQSLLIGNAFCLLAHTMENLYPDPARKNLLHIR